jgi:hypothetical protein
VKEQDSAVIDDIQDRLGNGRPPEDEDEYYDRYDVNEAVGDPADGGAKFTIRDWVTGNSYKVTLERTDEDYDWRGEQWDQARAWRAQTVPAAISSRDAN